MNRSERLQLRLTPYEKAQIAARALEAGMKLSDYARHRLLGKRIGKPRKLDPAGFEGVGETVGEFDLKEAFERFHAPDRD